MDDHHHNKRKNVHEINLGFSKETMMTSLFDSSIGMSSSSSASIQDYNSTFHDLEMLIHNNRDEYHFDSVDPFIDNIPPEYNSEVQVNTPNSCSISSSSTEAVAGTDDRKKIDDDDEDQDQEKAKKQLLKPKKKKQKKEREARFAFMTKSDVDHLDDGFRWRKYGQKAVKNSPFPRSYYRCTSTLCGVKKRVERCNEDPSTVVTTYEGTHTHPCPVMPRGTFGIIPEITRQMLPYQQQQPYFHHNLTSPRLSFDEKDVFSPPMVRERPFCPSASTASARDHGLLQDMLPSKMLKETKE